MSPAVRNLLALTLTIVGTLQMAGFVLKSEPLYLFGQALALAPLPVPFRDHNGYENFASEREYRITLADGRELRPSEKAAIGRITGPHRRKIVYTFGFTMLPREPFPIANRLAEFVFCKRGGIAVDLEEVISTSSLIKSIAIITTVKTEGGENWEHTYTFVCPS